MGAANAIGVGRFAVSKATTTSRRARSGRPRLAPIRASLIRWRRTNIELELARLMMQKAATLYDHGDDFGCAEAANMAKYAAGEASTRAVDQAVQSLGGNGLTKEYGVASMLTPPHGWHASRR